MLLGGFLLDLGVQVINKCLSMFDNFELIGFSDNSTEINDPKNLFCASFVRCMRSPIMNTFMLRGEWNEREIVDAGVI